MLLVIPKQKLFFQVSEDVNCIHWIEWTSIKAQLNLVGVCLSVYSLWCVCLYLIDQTMLLMDAQCTWCQGCVRCIRVKTFCVASAANWKASDVMFCHTSESAAGMRRNFDAGLTLSVALLLDWPNGHTWPTYSRMPQHPHPHPHT